jgi:hypothetical protein
MEKISRKTGETPAKAGEQKKKRQPTRAQTERELLDLTERLDDSDAEARIALWTEITDIIRTRPGALTKELVALLLNAQRSEEQRGDRVWRTAAAAISYAFFEMAFAQGEHSESPAGRNTATSAPDDALALPLGAWPDPESLGCWLWSDFKDRSLVLRVADSDRLKRDEDAVIVIARWLPHLQFPLTEFLWVDPGGFAPTAAKLDTVGAICFVGRLCLFGPEAVRWWGAVKPAPCHRFGMGVRPENLRRGELHRRYHSIVDTLPGSARKKFHRTEDKAGIRRDFGLVQRYFIEWAGKYHPVIHIAGCSSLGTLAAAHFATHVLFSPRPNGELWPLPPNIKKDSRFEALIEATAELEGSELGWRLVNTKILDLRVDNHVWSDEEGIWRQDRDSHIVIDLRKCSRGRGYRKEPQNATIQVNGEEKEFKPKSENRRLCLELCMRAKRGEGKVSVEELRKDTWIWNRGKIKKPADVRNRINYVLRQLGSPGVIRDGICHVNAKITVIGDASRNGGSR